VVTRAASIDIHEGDDLDEADDDVDEARRGVARLGAAAAHKQPGPDAAAQHGTLPSPHRPFNPIEPRSLR